MGLKKDVNAILKTLDLVFEKADAKEVAVAMGVSYHTALGWKNRNSLPSKETIQRLREHYGLPEDKPKLRVP